MNKIYLNHILVVEGKEDKCFLSNYIETPIVSLNGLDVKSKTFNLLKRFGNDDIFILLTDPDKAGETIRENIEKLDIKVINIKLTNPNFVRGKKKGIAESDIKDILKILTPYTIDTYQTATIDTSFMYKCGLIGSNSTDKRRIICNHFGVDYMKGKSFKLLLGILKINKDEIIKILEDGN